MIVFRASRWLDEQEFRELLKIADYNGYVDKGAVFIFNIDKALRNGYGFEDVLLLIREFGLELDGSSIEELKNLYEKTGIVIEWEKGAGYVKLRIPRSIYYMVRDIVRESSSKYLMSDQDTVVYRVLPIKLYDLVEKIRSVGYNIIDRDNLLKEKTLSKKPVIRNIVLRSYQEEALKSWVKNNYRGIIALPTGSGKTILGVAAIAELGVKTLIIAFTREQMFQWRDVLVKTTDIEPGLIGLIYSEEKKIAPITITTYQSGFRMINDISPYYDLLIVDEVHHLPADKFKYIALHSIARYRMGLSATPIREDGRHEELFPLLGGIVYYKSPAELASMGYLARYRVITVKVGLNNDERREYEELRRKYRALAGTRGFQEVLEDARKGDKTAIEALKIHSKMRMILARSRAKIDKAIEIALKELRNGGKIIIFTQYVDQAKELSKALNAHLLTGEIPVDQRRSVLNQYKSAPSGVLVVTTVGDEGLDIPDANVGILVSGTGSRRQFIQRLGRLLRPKKDGGEAKLYEIVLEKTPEEFQARKRKKIDLDEFLEDDQV